MTLAELAIVLAPDSDERRVDIEPTERHLMNAPLELRRGVPHPLFELAAVDTFPTALSALVEFVCQLEHRLHAACEV